MKKFNAHAANVNRVALGILFAVAGLIKLFVFKPAGVEAMLSGFGFPAAMFFAWVLILVELLGGLAILAKWKIKEAAYLLMVVMVIAAFTAYLPNFSSNIGSWTNFLLHLVAASNLWLIAVENK